MWFPCPFSSTYGLNNYEGTILENFKGHTHGIFSVIDVLLLLDCALLSGSCLFPGRPPWDSLSVVYHARERRQYNYVQRCSYYESTAVDTEQKPWHVLIELSLHAVQARRRQSLCRQNIVTLRHTCGCIPLHLSREEFDRKICQFLSARMYSSRFRKWFGEFPMDMVWHYQYASFTWVFSFPAPFGIFVILSAPTMAVTGLNKIKSSSSNFTSWLTKNGVTLRAEYQSKFWPEIDYVMAACVILLCNYPLEYNYSIMVMFAFYIMSH